MTYDNRVETKTPARGRVYHAAALHQAVHHVFDGSAWISQRPKHVHAHHAVEAPFFAGQKIVDVPGHERFIKNMLAGVGGTYLNQVGTNTAFLNLLDGAVLRRGCVIGAGSLVRGEVDAALRRVLRAMKL